MARKKIVSNLLKHLNFLGFSHKLYSINTGTGFMYHSEIIIDEYLVHRVALGKGKSEEEALLNAILKLPIYYRRDFYG